MSSQTSSLTELFAARGKWITKFKIDGRDYGGEFDAMNDPRVRWFLDSFPGVRRVLELGSLEGGHTFALAQEVEYVRGVEGRTYNVNKANLVRDLLGIRNCEFTTADIEGNDLTRLGKFDAVFCVGVLCHIRRPDLVLRKLSDIAPKLFLSTHYVAETAANRKMGQWRGDWYKEHSLDDLLSGLTGESFWPTLGSLLDMLTACGYEKVNIIKNDRGHLNGHVVTLAAERPSQAVAIS